MYHLQNETEGHNLRLKRLWARIKHSRLHRHVVYGLGAHVSSVLSAYLLLRVGWPAMIAEIVALVSMLYVFAALYEIRGSKDVD